MSTPNEKTLALIGRYLAKRAQVQNARAAINRCASALIKLNKSLENIDRPAVRLTEYGITDGRYSSKPHIEFKEIDMDALRRNIEVVKAGDPRVARLDHPGRI